MSRSDTELWSAILDDDPSAWSELVERYKSLVYATCCSVGLHQSDAKDVFQQTWLQLYRHRNRLKDPGRIAAWLVTTAKRESIHFQKRLRPRYSPLPIAERIDPNPGPEDELLAIERQAQLETAMKRLDAPCQAIMTAFFFAPEDRSYEDIAASLGYAPNTLGAKRRRCLDRLRKILITMGYLDERKSG